MALILEVEETPKSEEMKNLLAQWPITLVLMMINESDKNYRLALC